MPTPIINPASTTSAGGWYWSKNQNQGGSENSCDDACAHYGLECNQETVRSMLSAIDPGCSGTCFTQDVINARNNFRAFVAEANSNSDASYALATNAIDGTDRCQANDADGSEWGESASQAHSPTYQDAAGGCSLPRFNTNDNDYRFTCGAKPGQGPRHRLYYCTPGPPAAPPLASYECSAAQRRDARDDASFCQQMSDFYTQGGDGTLSGANPGDPPETGRVLPRRDHVAVRLLCSGRHANLLRHAMRRDRRACLCPPSCPRRRRRRRRRSRGCRTAQGAGHARGGWSANECEAWRDSVFPTASFVNS